LGVPKDAVQIVIYKAQKSNWEFGGVSWFLSERCNNVVKNAVAAASAAASLLSRGISICPQALSMDVDIQRQYKSR
jgi:hypothetical protein